MRLRKFYTGFILVGIYNMNECCLQGNIMERNRDLEIYRDELKKEVDDEIICISLNVNRLQVKG